MDKNTNTWKNYFQEDMEMLLENIQRIIDR